MRLEDHMNLAKAALPGRGKRGANLRRMVTVVIDYADPSNLAAQLKETFHAVKGFEFRANLADLDIQADPYGNRRRSYMHDVVSWHTQSQVSTVGATVAFVVAAVRYVLLDFT